MGTDFSKLLNILECLWIYIIVIPARFSFKFIDDDGDVSLVSDRQSFIMLLVST